MKIGIVTYHRTHNYGAVMQALATRFVLEKMGHKVYYVDYWPDYHRNKYALFSLKLMFSKGIGGACRYLKNFLKTYSQKKARIAAFNRFFSVYIDPFCTTMQDSFDVVVYGSDQIWRKQSSLNAYNPVYFGKNEMNAERHVSYAASMGVLPKNEQDAVYVKELVSHLSKISVREEDLLQLLQSMGYSQSVKSVDPTLLLTAKEWNELLPTDKLKSSEKYVLFYDLLYDSFDKQEIKKFAEACGLKLKVLAGYARNSKSDDVISTGDPLTFISLIKNAEFVFTSSFHGLVFSIIYNKPFYTAFRENEGRARSLLNSLGISDKLLMPMQKIKTDYESFDYDSVNQKLDQLKASSLNYLRAIGE